LFLVVPTRMAFQNTPRLVSGNKSPLLQTVTIGGNG